MSSMPQTLVQYSPIFLPDEPFFVEKWLLVPSMVAPLMLFPSLSLGSLLPSCFCTLFRCSPHVFLWR